MNDTITLDEILIWVIQHKQDTDAMNKINVATYPYTAKFLAKKPTDAKYGGSR
jgi:hypothetical protein